MIREVNRSRYGLQAGLFTNQISQMKYAMDNLEVGALMNLSNKHFFDSYLKL